MHKTSQHGASGRNVPGGGSAHIRIHGEWKLGRLPVWKEGGRRGKVGDEELGGQVRNSSRYSHRAAVPASDKARTAGAPRP